MKRRIVRMVSALALVAGTASTHGVAQTPEQLTEMAEQAEVLEAAPRLEVGDNEIDAAALAEGALLWLEPASDGLYEISSSRPGALVLGSFPTPDGRYDGMTDIDQHGSDASLDRPVSIGPVLLSSRHPYLVSASSETAAVITVRRVETFGEPIDAPGDRRPLQGETVAFRAEDDFDLEIPAATRSRRIDVIGEARAELRARLAGQWIPAGGLYPWRIDEPARLRIDVDVADGTPAATVLVRITEPPEGLDELEPDDDRANGFAPGTPFRAVLLPDDDDRLAFSVPVQSDMALSVATGLAWPRFRVRLHRAGERDFIWERNPGTGAVDDERLRLAAGDYELKLSREDGRPLPVPYTVSLIETDAAQPNHEVEPNDRPAAAMPMPASLNVRGRAAGGDRDYYRFSVPDGKAGHLWRLFAIDASRLVLSDRDGQVTSVNATGRRMRADSLALVPGEYTVEVRAEGDYVLRVMDLGDRPRGFETEPNDSDADGQRLEFGQTARGGFHRQRDIDVYLFRLDADSAVEITLVPPSDGRTDAKLLHGGRQRGQRFEFGPGDGPLTWRSTLPAGDWAVHLRSLDETVQENYEISLARLPALAGSEPDDEPLQAAKLPMSGDIAGSVGGFDGADQVFVPLPTGAGTAAMFCKRPEEENLGRWRLLDWSTGDNYGDVRNGVAVVDYGPEQRGALRFELAAGSDLVDYRCHWRFPPAEPPRPQSGTPAPDPTAALGRGGQRSFTLTRQSPEVRVPLGMAAGEIAALACGTPAGPLAVDDRTWQTADTDSIARNPLGPWRLLRAGPDAALELDGTRADALPLEVACALLAVDDLRRPSDMGPMAEFRPVLDGGTAGTSHAADGGPPPPGLEALIQRPTPDSQPSGDLAIAFAFSDVPELAGYIDAGQRFDVDVTLTNRSDRELDLALAANVAADGWRTQPSDSGVKLEPGDVHRTSVAVTAPPWLSPPSRPILAVRAEAEEAFAAAATEIPVAADANAVAPFAYWHAPDELRGGLNVLHYGLGARLVEIDGEAVDERIAEREKFVHDGLAPHIGGNNIQRDLVFRLPASTELAGAMIQLRATGTPANWPAAVEFLVPGADGWRRVGERRLTTRHSPQYIVFAEPVATERLRVRFPRCRQRCSQAMVQEIQAIAVPDRHPDGLAPINAADPGLGGHVVYADPQFRGAWNRPLLVADAERSNSGWRTNQDLRRFVVGFHHNRAALLRAVGWIGNPGDEQRIPEARVEYSLESPAGPWAELGTLDAPPIGELRSELPLDSPTWARYLRVTFDMPEEGGYVGPDAITAIEEPGTSVVGLWEDDVPRAAYEAATEQEPVAAVPPAGGPDRDRAAALPVDETVESSVLIERNEDWWRLVVPGPNAHELTLDFGSRAPVVHAGLFDADGAEIETDDRGSGRQLRAVVTPGEYFVRIHEPPRSVVITWDTSGSVSAYIPRTLAAVRTWARSLQPGRDALQLLPFGPVGFLLEDWAESPGDVEPALRELPEEDSSDSESALTKAANLLATRDGARGIVVITDAETGMVPELWPALLDAMPRVISLSVDSNNRQNAAIMMDWAALNGGRFRRVIGPLGMADGMDMANALFRAPKAYALTASLDELVEPEGEAQLTIAASTDEGAKPAGAVELILDASGSMLQRMEGRRRIDIAHEALVSLVRETLPAGMPFAFRAFGLERDACRTELLVPLGPLDRDGAAERIESVPAVNLAKTAIADSLLAAAGDLAETAPPRVVVLVTDGEETCDGDPEAAIEQLRREGLDARVNIVGFAIDDAELADTFARWAEAGGGAYFNAAGADALETSIAEALKPRFDLVRNFLDGRSERIGQAVLGETITVPAGGLTIEPASGAVGEPIRLDVAPDGAVVVEYAPPDGLAPPED